MKRRTLIASAWLPLLLLFSAGSAVADEQATDQQAPGEAPPAAYTYSDDWALVSAPPPQGPYNAINLDPRIPGQDLVAPMPMPDIEPPVVPGPGAAPSTQEDAATAPLTTRSPSSTAGTSAGQRLVPPQTPYDYQPGQSTQAQAARAQQTARPEQRGPGPARSPETQAYGPVGMMNAPYPGAGIPANRPQTSVAPVQQQRHANRPPPGHYRSRDYSQSGTRPMYGYPWPSRHSSSGYPAAGYSQLPWQGGDPRVPEVEVPPPSVYNRMMAEPPPARYAPPPGMMQYYGGGR